MKHFFFPYESEKSNNGILNDLFDNRINNTESNVDVRLKGIYDAVDTIYDKRLEKDDEELCALLGEQKENEPDNVGKDNKENKENEENKENKKNQENKIRYALLANYKIDDEEKINSYRIRALIKLWMCVEDWYRTFVSEDNCSKVTLILYHLLRGNICMRVSEIYYENYDLEESDMWGNKAIEILWHGKNLAVNYRDSLKTNPKNSGEAGLYLRIIKLNLAKYYRDYAGKNRRSDFDAALDEFKHVSRRVEEESDKIDDEYRRQYTLIWLDAILNIARIHREKYQLIIARNETLFMFYRLKDILQKDEKSYAEFSELIDATDKLAKEEHRDESLLGAKLTAEDLPSLSNDRFDKSVYLDSYDAKRYFLLVLLDLSLIRRYLHSVEDYSKAIFTAIIADEWSKKMDGPEGHNIDALNIISSSLRKYIKFEDEKFKIKKILKKITIKIGTEQKSLYMDGRVASLHSFVKKLYGYANGGHLKSKIEVIKWYCLYQQYPALLDFTEAEAEVKVDVHKKIQSLLGNDKENDRQDSEQNLQLRFLQGLVHFRKGEYKQAIDIYEKLIDPRNKITQYIRLGTIGIKARYTLANCYMSLAWFGKAEAILKSLHDALETARKSRNGQQGGSDADKEPRVEIDLAYCYMQRGAYKSAFQIYRELYWDEEIGDYDFDLKQVKRERCVMGLNNFAACCIFSINDESDDINDKIGIARRIFDYMDKTFGADRDDPETNLLKGYYTLCVGIEPEKSPIIDGKAKKYKNTTDAKHPEYQKDAIIMAHKYFTNACRFEMGFTERYVLLREDMTRNEARCRNEVERVSAYIINLIKLYNLKDKNVDTNLYARDIQRLILGFPTNYEISVKAAIALAEWLLAYDNNNQSKKEELMDQMYRSFGYVTIYEERGARVFNLLRDNGKFRLFTAKQRGKFFALLLTMYKPIKAIKEECCFNLKDKESTPHLVHYTSIDSLKKIFDKPSTSIDSPKKNSDKSSTSYFRINNCGYMNDVFEGNTFLNYIKLVAQNDQFCESEENKEYPEFIMKYFPQIDRPHEDMLPSGSNVYIGSLSVKEDSFPLWSIYAEKECGCNIEFGDGFFDINGTPYYPKALRDYLLSQYTDRDYPLYIVQYIGPEFKNSISKYIKSNSRKSVNFKIEDAERRNQHCGTRGIKYEHLFRLLQQIYKRWIGLDKYLTEIDNKEDISASKEVIYAFAADRINEIRFLFKDEDYEFEGEVRIVYTDYTDKPTANTTTEPNVPRVYVNIEREIKDVSVRLGSRIEDATVDKYVTWLKHTGLVKKVDLSKRNRYTHQTEGKDL